MLRMLAILLGIAFIFAGVAGFLPQFTKDGMLLGYFEVDRMHNLFHIITGVIAILAATKIRSTKWFFRLFGILYGVIAILGFYWNGDFSFIMMHMNMADNILHAVIAVIALYLGFLF